MKIADSITIIVDEEKVTLTPTLRCAMQLERRPGSLSRLARDVMDSSLTAALDIVEPHAGLNRDWLAECLLPELDTIKASLFQYVMACAGIDPDDAPSSSQSSGEATSVPFSEYLLGLYRLGTGWLGWSPEVTLSATPIEITEAQRGKLDMLKAVYGSNEETAPEKPKGPWDRNVRSILAGIGTVQEEAA